jgi:hypothetical protein
MSERIRYIKDTQITIAVDGSRCADKVCELRLDTGEPRLQLFQCHNWFYDDLARDALIEALQALRDHGNFASLKPEVKYRGLVPTEAAGCLQRECLYRHRVHYLDTISIGTVTLSPCDNGQVPSLTYQEFADQCTWYDTDENEPCGVQLP